MKFCINTSDHMKVYIKALRVPDIWRKITGQRLVLADCHSNAKDDVDLLIEAGIYLCLVDGNKKRRPIRFVSYLFKIRLACKWSGYIHRRGAGQE